MTISKLKGKGGIDIFGSNISYKAKMENLFSGLGTELVGFLLGVLMGGVGGYATGYNVCKRIKQRQKVGDNSIGVQIGEINNAKK